VFTSTTLLILVQRNVLLLQIKERARQHRTCTASASSQAALHVCTSVCAEADESSGPPTSADTTSGLLVRAARPTALASSVACRRRSEAASSSSAAGPTAQSRGMTFSQDTRCGAAAHWLQRAVG